MRVEFGRRFLLLYVLGVLCVGAVAILGLREDSSDTSARPGVAASLASGRPAVPSGGPLERGVPPGEVVASDHERGRDPEVPTTSGPVSAGGALVGSHPHQVLPLVPGTRVLTSSVAPSPGRLQVTLTAAGADADAVLAFYRVHLSGLGFRVVPGQAAGGGEAAFFSSRSSSVVITVDPQGDSYAVFAVLRSRRS